MKPLELTLGILTAVGGFVDISELVFVSQAGARFGYALIWVIVLATVGIIVFGEMSGRIAAVSRQPMFTIIRKELGLTLGGVTLIGGLVSTLVTCAAEIGGVALVLQLLTGGSYLLLAALATTVFAASIWLLPFKWIERSYGLLGLVMLVFAAALLALDPPWSHIAAGLVPRVPAGLSQQDMLVYGYFVVALISAIMFPYELYFYSSGGVEDAWSKADLSTNRVTSIVGMSLGALMAIVLLCLAAQELGPRGISPEQVGAVVLQPGLAFGKLGVILGLLGILTAVAGAAIETCLANAYAVSQFFGWRWGRHRPPQDTPLFTLAWLVVFALALALVCTGVEVTDLADYAVVLSIVVLPLSFLPLLLAGNDPVMMRDQVNGPWSRRLGWLFYGLVVLAAVAAVPLYLLTLGGKL